MKDFYPTPKPLIRKMIDGINFNEISFILEPSAGKGDICDYLKGKSSNGQPKLDVIEINENLQHILKGKKYNLIYDDFLSFTTYKKYDLIVANFPFSDGDKHLKKAIELLEMNGGNMVCLVNAETIKNPFTNLRETLVKSLKEHNANIEYLQEEFINAERKTNVEVALIKLTVEKDKFDSLILDGLKKSKDFQYSEIDNSQLIEKDFIKALISRFNMECSLGTKLIQEYYALRPFILDRISNDKEAIHGVTGDKQEVNGNEEELKAMGYTIRKVNNYSKPLIELNIGNASDYKDDYVNEYLKGVRYKYWSVLIGDGRFTQHFTSNIISDLNSKLQELQGYDFNLFNIEQLKIELNKKLVSGIEDAILELFNDMSHKFSYFDEQSKNIHYYNGWKTNKSYKINKKVILPMNGFSSWSSKDRLDYYIQDRMRDMVKVFNYFNKDLPNVPQLVCSKIDTANDNSDFRNINFHYFDATFYKKGTCHIVFKEQKLLDKFNIFGSQRKGWLPPSYGKKKYNEMNFEEKNVIDGFQGETEYNKVMSNLSEYIIDTKQLLLT